MFSGLPIAIGLTPPVIGAALLVALAGIVLILQLGTERVAWISVCVFVLFITWNGFRFGGGYQSGGAVGDAFMLAAFAAVGVHIAVAKVRVPFPPWLFAAATGYVLSALITLVFPPNRALAHIAFAQFANLVFQYGYTGIVPGRGDIAPLIELLLALTVVPLTIGVVGATRERCLRIADIWALSAIISAFIGVADIAGIHVGPTPLSSGFRSSGLTSHPNYLALSSAMAIPIALSWVGQSRNRTLAGAAGVALLFGGVYASGSRAGIVGALFALIATALVIPRLRRMALTAIPIVGMGLVVILFFTHTGHKILQQLRLTGGQGVAGSDTQRSMDATVAWHQFRSRPVSGVGFSVIADAHSIYLQLLAAGGVIALGSFLVFCAGILNTARVTMRVMPSDGLVAVSITVLVWLVNGVFDNQLADKYLYVIPGVVLAYGHIARARARAERVRSRPARRLLGHPAEGAPVVASRSI